MTLIKQGVRKALSSPNRLSDRTKQEQMECETKTIIFLPLG